MGRIAQHLREELGLVPGSTHTGIDDAVEFVLDHSCPKIRLVRGHKKRLRQPVETALRFVANLIQTLPVPLEITSEEALYELLIKPFFIDEGQLKTTLARDPELNDFLSRPPGDDFFVLLTMDRSVKTVFGSRIQGDLVQRDVAMKAVDFSAHKFRAPSETTAGFNRTLEKGVLQILAHRALENVLEEQSRKEELSRLKEEMTAKLKILAVERQDMVLERRAGAGRQSYEEAQDLLERIEDELDAINTRRLDSDYYLKEVGRVLGRPGDYLKARQIAMHFDRMGILLDGMADEEMEGVRVAQVELGDEFHRSCVPLKCNPKVLLKRR